MIDFRYHLVSIIAIFLALSVGIVLGSTFLQDPAIYVANKAVEQVTQRNTGLQDQITSLQLREGGNEALISAHTRELVRGALDGERVLLVELPGVTAADREGVQQVLEHADAAVSGQVALTEKYLDPKQTGMIDQLATAAKPAEMTLPADATPYEKAAAVLAAAVVTSDTAQVGRENPAAAGVLEAFQEGALITMSGDPALRASLAVVLAPGEPSEGDDAEAQSAGIIALAEGLDAADRGTVVTGPTASAGPGGVVAGLRDSGAAGAVSTVDNGELPTGRVVLVYALREQLSGGAGQYGTGPGASAVEPSPVPTSTPSSSSGG
ncbi:copper transporter [Spongiactinospora sp. TRM90649]|uniref:copper transporter n=1 Tax=Spongiactinospora sp. TRM90649 TaxID=3031114 RepID=UPI0023F977E1|nr:copper transporter [Spongiactinospora sp. TRM90649]MDF5759225.1 copper transporter [Spongiactinospora sp. TRM90649]